MKRVLKNKTDNIVLGTLILLSLYQTEKLWFGDSTDHSFFSNVSNIIDTNIEVGKEYFMEPKGMYLGKNNNKFMIVDIHKSKFSDVYKEYKRVLNNVLNEGAYLGKENIKLEELYKKDFIEIRYSLDISSEILKEELNISNDKNINKISKFNKVYALFEKEKKVFYFYRDDTNVADVVEYKGVSLNIDEEIESIRDIDVISAAKVNINGYKIIPFNKSGEEKYLTDFVWKNPITSTEGVDSYVNIYFENPSNIWKKEDEKKNTVIYGDDLNTVRYYEEEGVIEYNNNEIKGSSKLDFISSYYIARSFLETDEIYPVRDIYLKAHNETENGYSFEFEYIINNFTYISDGNTSIKVIVEGNKVKSLRRILKKLSVKRPFKAELSNYIDIANKYAKNESIDSISDIYMAYNKDEDDKLVLRWVIENKKGKRYVFDAYERVK